MGKKTINILMAVILCIFFTLSPVCKVKAGEDITLYSKAAVLMDADTGRVLYDKLGDERLPMASTTKIMTLIVTLENANTDDEVTVSSYAASMPKVHLGMKAGESYRLKDLLYSLMLESHNDSAVAIAEHVGGSVEGFADMMNEKAKAIGCSDTYYITPNGLDAEIDGNVHSTTAHDLALVMSYCITKSPMKDEFISITQTPSWTFSDLQGKTSYTCTNHNSFLTMMDGALSGKTGYTANAGYCYVGALRRDGKTLVVALLACGWPNNKTYKWTDTRKLMEYGLNEFEFTDFESIELPDEAFGEIYVDNAKGDSIGANVYVGVECGASEGVKGILVNKNENITVVIKKAKMLTAPVAKGEQIGYISYMADGVEWMRKNLVTTENIDVIDLKWCVEMVLDKWYIKNSLNLQKITSRIE